MASPVPLGSLFAPRSVAFIGASEDSDRFESMYRNLTEFGDGRDVYFVNPNRDRVYGEECFDAITDVPAAVDLAVVIVPAAVVPTVFEECCAAAVGAALVVSAGFGEAGDEGEELERELVRLSEEHDLPFCGPNSYGVVSVQDRTAAAQVSTLDIGAGNVAAILQSGGLLNQILYSGRERGFGFSKVVDSGNEAGLSSAEYIDYLIDDEHTDVIIGIIEGFSRPKRFVEAAEKASDSGVPLIVLKLARSDQGRTVAESHTGAVTSSDEVTSAVFEQYGVVQAESLDLLIELAAFFSKVRGIPGNGVGVIEISGAGCTLFTDAIADSYLELPSLRAETKSRIERHLPAIGQSRNPVDMAMGWGSPSMDRAHPNALDALASDPEIDVVVSRLSVPQGGDLGAVGDRLREVERMNEERDESFVVVSRTSGGVSAEWTDAVTRGAVPFLQEYHKAVRTLSAVAGYSAFRRWDRRERPDDASSPDGDPIEGRLTEYEAKRVLASAGFPTVDETLATGERAALDAAEQLGYPVCLKVVSPDIPHKTDVGGVRPGLDGPTDVRNAYRGILDSATANAPDARIDGVLVQEMIDGGVELLVGSRRTPFGQAVVVGLGGVFTELLGETRIRIAPFSPAVARDALESLRGYDVLAGSRGGDAVAVSDVAELLARYSRFVAAHDELVESDLNPVIVTPDGAHVVDALFRVSDD